MGYTKTLFEELSQALKPDEELKELERQYNYELTQSREQNSLSEIMPAMEKWCNSQHDKGICFLCAKEYNDCKCGTTECCKH